MTLILTVIHLLVAFGIIFVVLVQKGSSADMGAAFGGSSQSLFGARGSGSFLGKVTAFLATIFMLTSLTLAFFTTRSTSSDSVMKGGAVRPPATTQRPVDAAPKPGAASAPVTDPGSDIPLPAKTGVSEEKAGGGGGAPDAHQGSNKPIPAFPDAPTPPVSGVKPQAPYPDAPTPPVSGVKSQSQVPQGSGGAPAGTSPLTQQAKPSVQDASAQKASVPQGGGGATPADAKPPARQGGGATPADAKPPARQGGGATPADAKAQAPKGNSTVAPDGTGANLPPAAPKAKPLNPTSAHGPGVAPDKAKGLSERSN
ncbi:MAG: preprotein translocase subunit SecG [Magnetococcales bacterium]|nr:preprotein translocase subunit SecG [Magnetococcales bacterium]